jgi:hypothetical protein
MEELIMDSIKEGRITFRVGDEIVVKKGEGMGDFLLVEGKIYVIESISEDGYIAVKGGRAGDGWYPNRFRKATKKDKVVA